MRRSSARCKAAWDDVASRQMYITGGVSVDEYYRDGYVRPLTGDVIETCATMTWMELTQSLLELTGDVRYADVIERLLFNQVFASQAVDGDCHRVNTPPNGSKPEGYFRGPERPCDCCTSSGHRLISLLPRSFYAQDQGGLFVNQFVPSTVDFHLADGTAVTAVQDTGYPESDAITIRVNPEKPSRFAPPRPGPRLVRAALGRRGRRGTGRGGAGSYARLDRIWSAGDTVRLRFPMSFRWVEHDHYPGMLERRRLPNGEKAYVKAGDDATPPWALIRGPEVFALDTVLWGDPNVPAPDEVWKEAGIVRAASDPPRPLATPPGSLGPSCEVTVRLVSGPVVKATMTPFANVGRWYRDGEPRPRRDDRAFSYAVWLQDSDGPGFARMVEERRRSR